MLSSIAERLCKDILSGKIMLTAKQAKERALLYDINAVNAESIDDLGNWILDIGIERQRWRQLCGNFKDLENSFVIE